MSTPKQANEHFARPKGNPTPTHGKQSCAVCGQAIERKGTHMNSDGVKGSWQHTDKPAKRGRK